MAKRGAPPRRQPVGQQPTLGQATGGRPGRVPPGRADTRSVAPNPKRLGATPVPGTPPQPRGLGLGLGLNPRQQRQFQAAAQQGQGAQYMGTHPGIANRVQNRVQVGTPQETRLQNFLATGQRQRPGMTPQPPVGGMVGGNLAPAGSQLPLAPGIQPMPRGGTGAMPGTINGMSPADFQAQNPELFQPGGMFGANIGPQQQMGFGVNPGMESVLAARGVGGGGGMGGGAQMNPFISQGGPGMQQPGNFISQGGPGMQQPGNFWGGGMGAAGRQGGWGPGSTQFGGGMGGYGGAPSGGTSQYTAPPMNNSMMTTGVYKSPAQTSQEGQQRLNQMWGGQAPPTSWAEAYQRGYPSGGGGRGMGGMANFTAPANAPQGGDLQGLQQRRQAYLAGGGGTSGMGYGT